VLPSSAEVVALVRTEAEAHHVCREMRVFTLDEIGRLIDALGDTVLEAKRKVTPALVHIQPILEIYRSGEREKMAVTGSGVIISADGYVLTNNHVVERAEQVTCTLHNQQEVSAELIGRDVFTDLAIIQLNITTFDAVKHFALPLVADALAAFEALDEALALLAP